MWPSSIWTIRSANGTSRGSWVTTRTPRFGSLAISARIVHDRLAVLAVERRGRLVGQDDRRIADDRARDRDPLLLAAAELARIGHRPCAPGRPWPAPPSPGPWRLRRSRRARRAPAARCRRPSASETGDRTGTRSRCDRAGAWPDPPAPAPSVELPRTRTVPSVGVSMQPSIGQQRGLAAAGRPHQQGQLAAAQRQVDALERAHLRGARCPAPCATSTGFDAPTLAHRVNTMAGSMRVTLMMAAIAETTHMTTVSRNRPDAKLRRDDDRQRARRGRRARRRSRSAPRG